MMIGVVCQWFGGKDMDFIKIGMHSCPECGTSFQIVLLGLGIGIGTMPENYD